MLVNVIQFIRPSVCATFQGQSTFDNVTQQTNIFKFVTVFHWGKGKNRLGQNGLCTPGCMFREQGPVESGDGCARVLGDLRAWPPSFVFIVLVFCLLHCLSIEWTRSTLFILTENPAPRLPLLGLVHWEGKPDIIRPEKRFCFHPWCCPGWWGNSLINSVAGLGHACDPGLRGHSGYSKLKDERRFRD